MSISFAGLPGKQYIGQLYPLSVRYSGQPGRVVPLHVDWASYGVVAGQAGQVINVTIRGSNQGQLLDRIRSIKIDNTASDVSCYILAPDTQDMIVAPPNTTGWYPIMTNVFEFQIVMLNFGNRIPSTQIFVSNIDVIPFTDVEIGTTEVLYKGSPLIQRTNTATPGYGLPALGDQLFYTTFELINAFLPTETPVNFNGLPFGAPGFLYMTDVRIWCSIFKLTFNADTFNAAHVVGAFYDKTLGINAGGLICGFEVGAYSGPGNNFRAASVNTECGNLTNCNIRLNLSDQYSLLVSNITSDEGQSNNYYLRLNLQIAYTNNPT